jgi:hypothetical protein
LCKRAQQLFKQSGKRQRIFLDLASSLGAMRVLKMHAVFTVRFIESECGAFKALLEGIPLLVNLCDYLAKFS